MDHIGSFRIISPFLIFRTDLDYFGPYWNNLDHFETYCIILDIFGPFQSVLGKYNGILNKLSGILIKYGDILIKYGGILGKYSGILG